MLNAGFLFILTLTNLSTISLVLKGFHFGNFQYIYISHRKKSIQTNNGTLDSCISIIWVIHRTQVHYISCIYHSHLGNRMSYCKVWLLFISWLVNKYLFITYCLCIDIGMIIHNDNFYCRMPCLIHTYLTQYHCVHAQLREREHGSKLIDSKQFKVNEMVPSIIAWWRFLSVNGIVSSWWCEYVINVGGKEIENIFLTRGLH